MQEYDAEKYGVPATPREIEATLRRIKGRAMWSGTITKWNVEALADRIRELLHGRRFTYVELIGGKDALPWVWTSQVLKQVDGIPRCSLAENMAMISINSTYGVRHVSTFSESVLHMGGTNPTIEFDNMAGGERFVRITQRNGFGEFVVQQFALENEDPIDTPDQICITWSTDDVLSVRPWLTQEQAQQVLAETKRCHDAHIGITWEVIKAHGDRLYPAQ